MYRKLHYVSEHNKLVQLVVKVKYHVNIFIVLGAGTHTHTRTDIADKSNFKKPGVCHPKAGAPGLKVLYIDSFDGHNRKQLTNASRQNPVYSGSRD